MKEKKLLLPFIILVICMLAGCSNNAISKKVIDGIDIVEDDKYIVNMSELTDFDWDTLVAYSEDTDKDSLKEFFKENFNINLKEEYEYESGLVFIYNNKIVYKETYDENDPLSNFSVFSKDKGMPYKHDILREVNKEKKIHVYDPQNDVFYAEKLKDSEIVILYYE